MFLSVERQVQCCVVVMLELVAKQCVREALGSETGG